MFKWFRNKKLEELQARLQREISKTGTLAKKNVELQLNVTSLLEQLNATKAQVNSLNNAISSKSAELSSLRTKMHELRVQPEQERAPRGKQDRRVADELKQLRRRTDSLISLEPLLRTFARSFNKASKGTVDDIQHLNEMTSSLGNALVSKRFHQH